MQARLLRILLVKDTYAQRVIGTVVTQEMQYKKVGIYTKASYMLHKTYPE